MTQKLYAVLWYDDENRGDVKALMSTRADAWKCARKLAEDFATCADGTRYAITGSACGNIYIDQRGLCFRVQEFYLDETPDQRHARERARGSPCVTKP